MDGVSQFLINAASIIPPFLGKIILALVVWFVGKFLIKKLLGILGGNKKINQLEGTVKSFILSLIKVVLYALLAISVIGILGVQTASIITALASAGVAVGLALQGALSNLAGGIMLIIFKPFKVGDFIEASGVSGVVNDVTLFYTVLTTLDNKRITIPNGTLMNANVIDYSSEENRRVDLDFSCAKTEDPNRILDILQKAMAESELVISDPAEPFAAVSGGTNEAMNFTVRAWTKSENYWDVYFDLIHRITVAFGQEGVEAPALRVSSSKEKKEA